MIHISKLVINYVMVYLAAVRQESFSSSYDAKEADDAATYGLIALTLIGAVATCILFSDLTALLQALRFMKYNLHLTNTNPFAPTEIAPKGSAQSRDDDTALPYYYTPRSRASVSHPSSHFSALRSFPKVEQKRRIYMSQ